MPPRATSSSGRTSSLVEARAPVGTRAMAKRSRLIRAELLLAALLAPVGALAQESSPNSLELRAGGVIPVGSYAEDSDLATGWSAGAAYVYQNGRSALALEYDRAFLGPGESSDDVDVTQNLVSAGVRYYLGEPDNVFLGASALAAKETVRLSTGFGDRTGSSDWSPGFAASTGVRASIAPRLDFLLDGRYVWYRPRMGGETSESANTLVQIRAGLVIPLGAER